MVENQNVSFIYEMPDITPEGMIQINFLVKPVVPFPGDISLEVYFMYNVEEV